jgi:hypothetical protein
MKRAIKHTSNIYEYLEAIGVLDTGTNEEIQDARKQYWKNYRAAYQRQKRKEQHIYTITFNKKEMRLLAPAIKKHHSNCTQYIKLAVLAYTQQQFVVLDPAAINQIRELLTKNYTTLQNIEEKLPEGYLHISLIKQFAGLEQNIIQALHSPDTLEKAIRDSIESKPEMRHAILKILEA